MLIHSKRIKFNFNIVDLSMLHQFKSARNMHELVAYQLA